MNDDVPSAKHSAIGRISPLWFVPFLTLLVGVWVVYTNWSNQGPLITITLATADGLEEGKTKVKTRNVEVGKVERIMLNKSLDGVIIKARMNNSVKPLLNDSANFWVVQPTIGFSGVSGLGTLLSGQYIEFAPGDGGKQARGFTGLEKPPLTPLGTPGLHVTLNTEEDISFSEGDIIHFQGFKVGKIEDVFFNFSERMIYYNAFIEAPYHQLITTNTRFWNATGISAEITTQGISLQTGPLASLISGGISFSVPDGEPLGESITERDFFYIYPSRSAIHEKQYVFSIQYVMMVDSSVAGLQSGSPLLYRGIQVGKVLRTDYIAEDRNLLDREMKIPIFLEIEPGRLGLPDSEDGKKRAAEDIAHWLRQGLSATIETRNILLGQQQIKLDYNRELATPELSYFNDIVMIPTGQGGFSKVADSVTELVDKLNGLPIEAMGDNLVGLFREGKDALGNMNLLAQSGEQVISEVHQQRVVESISEAIGEVDKLSQSFSQGSETNRDLQRLLESMSTAFEELRPLLSELKNKPNGLIFTGRDEAEVEPKRKQR